jgi:hypothetical protein
LKSNSERDFADPQIPISQEITRVFEPNTRYILDKIYARYLLKLFAQVIRADVDSFRHFGQGKHFVGVFFDVLARFPDLDWLSSMVWSSFLGFMCEQHLNHPKPS